MAYIPFDEVKQRVSIEDAVKKLGLMMVSRNNQLRSSCPSCKSGDDRALAVTPSKNLFYCFSAGKGGDQIALVAHIKNVEMPEAAQFLIGDSSPQRPQNEKREPTRQFDPEAYIKKLEPEHPAVEAVGFDPETARALGVGFASSGVLAGLVAVPVRLSDGTISGFIGITEARLPKSFNLSPSNVVRFPKTA